MTRENLFKRSVYARQLEVVSRRVKIAESETPYLDRVMQSPEDVYKCFKNVFQEQPAELFLVIHLRTNNAVNAFEIVTKGTLNSSLAHPREVYRSAILQNAASIIAAHNHPSGNAMPSQEDIQITKQLVEAGKIIGIPLNDHVIFTEERYYSFAESGNI